jgi:hypothetical protein
MFHSFTIKRKSNKFVVFALVALGGADLAHAIPNNRLNRANGKLGYHVLESMFSFLSSSENGKVYTMKSTCERPTFMDLQGI